MKKTLVLVILFVFSTNINLVNASDEILLKSRRFIPAKGISPAAKAKIEAIPRRAHVLIQLEQIPTVKEREELEAKGIKLLSYIPNKAWFASIHSDKATAIASPSNVRKHHTIDHRLKELNRFIVDNRLAGITFDQTQKTLNKAINYNIIS